MTKEIDQTDVDETDEEAKGPKQRVRRMPASEEVGPFFPSGMSAPEAAMAGATANLSDDEKQKIQEQAAQYGLNEDGSVPAPEDDA